MRTWIFYLFLPLALLGQNTYFGPNHPIPGNPQLIRIQVLVQDEVGKTSLKITSVQFNGQLIPLKPADIFGNRGSASFQVPPGTYKLKWVVNRDDTSWPREVKHEEIVDVSPRDSWVQISIIGEKASIL